MVKGKKLTETQAELSAAKEGQLRLDIAKANDSAKEAEARAAEANLELEKFKAPRTLSDAQLKNIGAKVSGSSGQEFDVTPYWDLKESLGIANRIADALILGGWKYVPPAQSGFMLGGTAGVQVWVHPSAPDGIKKAAEAAVNALNREGIATVIKEQNPKNPIDTKLHLNVGVKP